MRRLTREEFIEIANKKHKFKYDYSETIYNGVSSNITVRCKKHGYFTQSARNHAYTGSGCSDCSSSERSNKINSRFAKLAINSFIKTHGLRYDYSNFNYKNNATKSEIVCREHGSFYQSANNHKAGKGCPKCCKATMNFKKKNYIDICKKNHNSKSKIYLLEIRDYNDLLFYKIGITVQKISNRFSKSVMPYNYKVLMVVESDAELIFDAEIKIKKMVSKNIYRPMVKFPGSKYECFTEISDDVYGVLDSLGGKVNA